MIDARQWNRDHGAPDGSLDHQVDVIPSALIPKIQADARQSNTKPIKFLLSVVFLSAFCYLLVTHFFFRCVIVSGTSMMPTLHNAEIYTLKTYAYYFHKPKVGDIVVLKDPTTKTYAVKRIVATEYQSVSIFVNGVYVNGRKLNEWYLPAQTYRYAPYVNRCNENEYFVLGDNRGNSADSREYGPISIKNIMGQIQP